MICRDLRSTAEVHAGACRGRSGQVQEIGTPSFSAWPSTGRKRSIQETAVDECSLEPQVVDSTS
jgi:hypothetical protein